MLLINDNEAKLGHRRKNCKPCANYDLCLTGQCCREMSGARRLGDFTMQTHHGNAWEALCNTRFKQGGQINLGHQQQNLFALIKHRLNQA